MKLRENGRSIRQRVIDLRALSKRPLTYLVAAILCSPGMVLLSMAQEARPLYPVRGVVRNTLTHQPIPRVLVDGIVDAALTDGEGRFELELPEGVGQIQVRRPGYNSRGQEVSHAVNVGANLPNLTFYLTPQASITGHVTLSSGDDPNGIQVSVYLRHTLNGHPKWRIASGGSTNTEGVFRLANLETPGIYAICSAPIQDRNFVRNTGARRSSTRPVARAATGDSGYPSVCYPGPLSESAETANLLPISPGQQIEFELSLNRQPFYAVTIAVPNAPLGLPVGVQIFDTSGRALEYSASWNQQRGEAEVKLPNGQYYAEGHAGGQVSYFGRVDFHVDNAPLQALSMPLLPLHPIPVEVRRQFVVNARNDQPRSQTDVFPLQEQDDPGVNLSLIPANSVMGDPTGGGLGQRKGSSDKSLFELDGVVPGRYWVQTTPYQGYISSVTSGATDLTREPLIVGPGNSTAPIQITLRKDGGKIQCAVNPAQSSPAGPSPGEMGYAFVYAIPETPNGSQISQTALQGAGTVVLADLAPGRYRVIAIDKNVDMESASPAELARLSALGKPVTVEAGGETNIELDLIPAAGIESEEGSTP